jgi:energy-coupling factor transporter ATP-binding protein EcfA2
MFDINKILTDVKDTQLKRLEEINHKIKQEQLKMDPTGKSSANSFTTQLTNEVSKYLKTFPGNTPEPEPEPEQAIEGDKRDKGENGEKGKKETKKEKSNHNNNKGITTLETSFKLPICYLEDKDKRKINTNILNDLELLEVKNDDCIPMYETIFKPESIFSKKFVSLWSRYYTTNVDFLKESQTFYQSYVNQYGCKLSEPLRMILDDTSCNTSDNNVNNYTYKPYKPGDEGSSISTGVIIFPHDVYNTIDKLWLDIACDKNFKQRFSYIDFPMLDNLNKSPVVMQLMSIYNLTSPVISLLSPLILLFIPFFLLKIQKSQVSMSTYITSLKTILSSHPIGKVFSLLDFSSMPWDKRIYVLMSVFFYFIQVYQNVMSCHRFYKNMILIHKNIFILNDYFRYTIRNMKHVIQMSHNLITYREFTNDLKAKVQHLEKLCGVFSKIKPFAFSFKKFIEIGKLMKLNYEIFVDHDIKSCVDYSFGFNGFYENIDHIKQMIDSSRINPCVFIGDDDEDEVGEVDEVDEDKATTIDEADELPEGEKGEKGEKNKKSKKNTSSMSSVSNISKVSKTSTKSANSSTNSKHLTKKHTSFTQLYYPPHETPIKNDVVINKKIIITGPNAAGKTTIIKSTLMNIILSQQIGYGFYDSASIRPYDYLHSYLNIPDTSGRDSLFQAESRRCKDILDSLEKENDKRHFCIFDELYSGTNPYEAVASAYGYIDYLSTMKNVDLMLTTHYISLCNNLKTNKKIKNYKMKVNVEEDYNLKYLYKMERGISKIKGGIKVLYDLDYPKVIIENTKQLLMSM